MNSGIRIIVAEDSPTQAIKLGSLLHGAGYQPDLAKNGFEALEKLRRQPADLVISDVMMPEMSGYELCAAIKKSSALKHIPVILLTSLNEIEDVIRGLEHQADYYVTKPYDQDYLLSKVHAIVSGQSKVEVSGNKLVVTLQGHQYQVSANRSQMLNLLLSTYENAVLQNQELSSTHDQLEKMNAQLADNLAELEASELRFRSLVQTIPDIVYRLSPDGNFTFINEAVSRLGFTPEELLGHHFSAILEPSEVPRVSRDEVLTTMRGVYTGDEGAPKLFDERRAGDRRTTGLEVMLCCKNGGKTLPGLVEPLTDELLFAEVNSAGLHQARTMDDGNYFIGTVGVIRDISVRKRLEKDLELVNAQLERKVEERTSALAASNRALEDEIAQRRRAEADLQRSLEEVRRAHLLAQEMELQLRQAQKMEAVGTLAGGVAHEFNNILSVMMGYSEIALDEAREGGTNPEYLEEVIRSGERAKDLIKQVLTFSHRVQPQLKALDVNQEVSTAANLLKTTLPKMIDLQLSLGEDLPLIPGDSGQIQQILMNLATNARDAMPDGGDLLFETSVQMVENESCMACSSNFSGQYLVISVSDTGSGIDEAVLQRIFEPFFTTKEVGSGTGLGLATVLGIVQAHDGHITCESALGQGSIFRLFLPVASVDKAASEQAEQMLALEACGHETILLVDDEEALRWIGKIHLSNAGYTILEASNGEQALEVFKRRNGKVDLVILDLSMPGMGGRKCLEALVLLDPQIKVIISSGYSRDGDLQRNLSENVSALLSKPYSKADLLTMVRAVLDNPAGEPLPNN